VPDEIYEIRHKNGPICKWKTAFLQPRMHQKSDPLGELIALSRTADLWRREGKNQGEEEGEGKGVKKVGRMGREWRSEGGTGIGKGEEERWKDGWKGGKYGLRAGREIATYSF